MDGITGKKVLVTGASGFLGQHVVNELSKHECRVLVPTHQELDVRYANDIMGYLSEHRPNTVIHLAAKCGGIGANKERPADFFFDNLMMGMHLMNESMHYQVEKYVQVGTVCSYPKFCPTPFKEEDLWNGYPEETNAPYGIAKKALLVQAQAYRQQYGFNAITLIPVNLYGPGDNFDPSTSHVIPALIKKCIDARETEGQTHIEVWGTGTAEREFLYVKDAAEGIVQAAMKYDKPDPVNLGTGVSIDIETLLLWIRYYTRYSGGWKYIGGPDGQPKRMLSTKKALDEFGFYNKTTFLQGLRETIDWYENSRRNIVVPSI